MAIQLAIIAVITSFSLLALRAGKGTGALTLRPLYTAGLFHAKSVFTATSICVMSFLGFDAISTLSEEVASDDRRVVGRAIVGVLFLSAALFTLLAWVFGNLMSGLAIKDPASAIYELAGSAIGPWASVLIAWATVTVVGFTNALPMRVGVARVTYAMGRDRQLPAVLAKVHAIHGTPYVGMIVTTAISMAVALAMRSRMDDLVSIVNFRRTIGFLHPPRVGDRFVLGEEPIGTMDRSLDRSPGRDRRGTGGAVRHERAGDCARTVVARRRSRVWNGADETAASRASPIGPDPGAGRMRRVCRESLGECLMSRKPRARELGLPLPGKPGRNNAITDVPGVDVGFKTLAKFAKAEGDTQICTGVTAILPRGRDPRPLAVWAGQFDLNGNGRDDRHALDLRRGLLRRPDLPDEHALGRRGAPGRGAFHDRDLR